MIPVVLAIGLFVLRAVLATAPLENLRRVELDARDPKGAVAYEGSLLIARGGPVIVGFQSLGSARLVVGSRDLTRGDAAVGKEIVGRGLHKERIVLPAGPVAIHFAAAGDRARLLWSPVGRRGEPEYVPASSLSPLPPEQARVESFGAFAGAAPLDGVFAAALLLVLVGTLCMLARGRLRAVDRRTWIAMGAVFAGACIVRWIGLSSYGQAWDEDVNWSSGRNYITNLLSADVSAGSWEWNFEHPPVMKYLAGIGAQFADGYGPARALSAVWTAIGCALLVPIGARLYRFRVGVLAGLIAALLPPLVAHGKIVGHESPTVLWWALGILLALGVHDGEPSQRQLRLRLVAVGAAIGIAGASRFVGGLLGPVCLAIVIVQSPFARRRRTAIEGALIMPAVAVATLYAVWPRLWAHPIAALSASLGKLSKTHPVEPWLGGLTSSPGPHYFLVYLAATLPVAILAGVLIYVVRAARERDRSALVVAAWFVLPLAVIFSPVRQDGVRYVMPCVLALALIGAAGWDYLLARAHHRFAFAGFSTVLALYLAITLARVHPYYLDYFGEHVGGPSTVAQRRWFETAWWGEGVDRAVAYVNSHAETGARVFRDCIQPYHLAWFREDLWQPMTHNPNDAQWLIHYTPSSGKCPIPADAKRVYTVEVQGAELAIVWKR